MSALLASVLISAATKVGAPLVKDLLEKYVGGTAGEIGGMIVDTIAGHAGVDPTDLPDLPDDRIEAAVVATEAETPAMLIQWNVQQRQAIDLMRAEMDKGGAIWTWAWRPAWMWFLGFLFAFRLVFVPIADAALGSSVAATVPLDTMMTLTTWFMALYMGGHTIKDAVGKWVAK